MSVMIIVKGKGMNADLYERVCKEAGVFTNLPKGMKSHSFGLGADGSYTVVDIAEDAGEFQKMFQSRILPVLQKHKVPNPDVSIVPLVRSVTSVGPDRVASSIIS